MLLEAPLKKFSWALRYSRGRLGSEFTENVVNWYILTEFSEEGTVLSEVEFPERVKIFWRKFPSFPLILSTHFANNF